MIPGDTVVPAQRSVSVHPSAQCIPHVGHTHSVWCRSTVHPHVTNRSDGRPGPLVVHRCPAGQPLGGTRTQPRGVRCHFDQSISRAIEQVYERPDRRCFGAVRVCAGQRRMSVGCRTVVLCPDRVNSADGSAVVAMLEDRLDAADLARELPSVATVVGAAERDAGTDDDGARVVNLREVSAFPIPAVEVGELASMLSSVPVADVSDVALVNMVSAWQQVLNMAQAAQAEVIREIEARTTDALARVPDELACALACTRRAATDLFLRAWGAGQHPSLTDAWAAGAVDARKVDVILAETVHAAPDAVGAVITDAVARAGDLTAPQLTRHVRAAVIATSPHVAEKRRVAERSRRSLELVLAPDAMARLVAYLPAEHATAAFTAIDALAGHAAGDGDDRTVDQRRADAFTDIFTSILDRQTTPDGTPLPRRHGQRASSRSRSPPPPCSAWTTTPRPSAPTAPSPPRSPASSPRTPPGAAS